MERRAKPVGARPKWFVRVAALALAAAAGGAFVLTMAADGPKGSGSDAATSESRGPGRGGISEGAGTGARVQGAGVGTAEPVPAPHFFGVTTPSGPYNLEELEQFQTAAGKKPAVLMFSQDWAQGPVRTELLDSIAARQMLPMITWEPRDHTRAAGADQPEYSLPRILDGTWDSYIRDWAAGIRDWRRPLAVRFGQQMNGNWFPWAEGVNGNQAGQYAQAWKHIRRIFSDVGASNAIWVWSPNISYTGSTPLVGLYPGDEYVDWVGIDGYNGGSELPWGGWVSPEQLFGATINEVRDVTAKPLVLTEVASTERGGNKAAWVSALVKMVGDRRDLLGFIWVEAAREADWRISSSAQAARAFKTSVADARFGPVPMSERPRSG